MGCAASQQPTSAAPRAVTHLTVIDLRLLTVLRSGAIKLLDASFLRDGSDEFIRRRQDLEQLERETGTCVFIPPEMAATLLSTYSLSSSPGPHTARPVSPNTLSARRRCSSGAAPAAFERAESPPAS